MVGLPVFAGGFGGRYGHRRTFAVGVLGFRGGWTVFLPDVVPTLFFGTLALTAAGREPAARGTRGAPFTPRKGVLSGRPWATMRSEAVPTG